jgi:hypothetical protein
MKFKIDDLEVVLKKLLQKAKNSNINEVEISHDYYWNIDLSIKYEIDKNPDLDVGSLKDDIESLNKLIKNSKNPDILDFERLGNVLIYISEYISKSKNIY